MKYSSSFANIWFCGIDLFVFIVDLLIIQNHSFVSLKKQTLSM